MAARPLQVGTSSLQVCSLPQASHATNRSVCIYIYNEGSGDLYGSVMKTTHLQMSSSGNYHSSGSHHDGALLAARMLRMLVMVVHAAWPIGVAQDLDEASTSQGEDVLTLDGSELGSVLGLQYWEGYS